MMGVFNASPRKAFIPIVDALARVRQQASARWSTDLTSREQPLPLCGLPLGDVLKLDSEPVGCLLASTPLQATDRRRTKARPAPKRRTH